MHIPRKMLLPRGRFCCQRCGKEIRVFGYHYAGSGKRRFRCAACVVALGAAQGKDARWQRQVRSRGPKTRPRVA